MGCVSPLKGWKDLDTGGIVFKEGTGSGQKMEVACGQCLTCRVDYSRMWAARIMHEAGLWQFSGGNCFITLTYRSRNECTEEELRNRLHVPDDWGLHKSHFQKFMKRLRKAYPGQKIKYFMCGEYGDTCRHGLELSRNSCPLCNVGRPHYHAAVFNLDFADLESYAQQDGIIRWTSPTLERLWGYGFVDVGELNFDSAAYVAGYVLKKVTGQRALDHYLQTNLDGECTLITPEFVLMSRGYTCVEHRGMPYQEDCEKCSRGIGYEWFTRYESDFFPSDKNPVPGKGVFNGVPRYYEEVFKGKDPATLEEIKELRKEFRKAHWADYTPDRLMDKYKVAKANQRLYGGRNDC